MSKTQEAMKLVDSGATVAEAAKETGITRQAIFGALKARKLHQSRAPRSCSECGAILAATAREDAMTCSGKCRVARSRRLLKEGEATMREKIERERSALGLPPLQNLTSRYPKTA